MTVTIGNRQLPPGPGTSPSVHPAAPSIAVQLAFSSIALGTTRSAAAARKVLAEIDQDDIRIRAEQILGELQQETPADEPTARTFTEPDLPGCEPPDERRR